MLSSDRTRAAWWRAAASESHLSVWTALCDAYGWKCQPGSSEISPGVSDVSVWCHLSSFLTTAAPSRGSKCSRTLASLKLSVHLPARPPSMSDTVDRSASKLSCALSGSIEHADLIGALADSLTATFSSPSSLPSSPLLLPPSLTNITRPSFMMG